MIDYYRDRWWIPFAVIGLPIGLTFGAIMKLAGARVTGDPPVVAGMSVISGVLLFVCGVAWIIQGFM